MASTSSVLPLSSDRPRPVKRNTWTAGENAAHFALSANQGLDEDVEDLGEDGVASVVKGLARHGSLNHIVMESDHTLDPLPTGKASITALRRSASASLNAPALIEDVAVDTLAQGPAMGSSAECECCYETLVAGQYTTCSNAASPHAFCFSCAKRNSDEAIVKASYGLECFELGGCKEPFAESEIQRFLDQRAYRRFDRLRTDHFIREAGLEGLFYCTFCPYAAVIDSDATEFLCPSCKQRSCPKCDSPSHRPKTCDEFQRERNRSAGQVVEEAMSEALVRKCNRCSLRFVKQEGCNQMTCRCGNRQCYVCGQNVLDYSHFDPGGRCPMYCDERLLSEVQVGKARDETIHKLRQEKPDLRVDELPKFQKSTEAGLTRFPQVVGIMHPAAPYPPYITVAAPPAPPAPALPMPPLVGAQGPPPAGGPVYFPPPQPAQPAPPPWLVAQPAPAPTWPAAWPATAAWAPRPPATPAPTPQARPPNVEQSQQPQNPNRYFQYYQQYYAPQAAPAQPIYYQPYYPPNPYIPPPQYPVQWNRQLIPPYGVTQYPPQPHAYPSYQTQQGKAVSYQTPQPGWPAPPWPTPGTAAAAGTARQARYF